MKRPQAEKATAKAESANPRFPEQSRFRGRSLAFRLRHIEHLDAVADAIADVIQTVRSLGNVVHRRAETLLRAVRSRGFAIGSPHARKIASRSVERNDPVIAVSVAHKDLATLSIVPNGGRRAEAIPAFIVAEFAITRRSHEQSATGIEFLYRMIVLAIRPEYPYCAVAIDNQILLIKGPLGYFPLSRQMIISSPIAEETAARVKFNTGGRRAARACPSGLVSAK